MSVRYSAPRCSFISSKPGAVRRALLAIFRPALALLSILAVTACATDNYPELRAAPPGTALIAPEGVAPEAGTGLTPAASVPTQKQLSGVNAPPTQSLIGKAGSDLVALLGRPALVHKERGAEVWQYAGNACVMLFYLYDDTAGARRVSYLEAVPQGMTSLASTGDVTPQTCLAYQMLSASGRPLS